MSVPYWFEISLIPSPPMETLDDIVKYRGNANSFERLLVAHTVIFSACSMDYHQTLKRHANAQSILPVSACSRCSSS